MSDQPVQLWLMPHCWGQPNGSPFCVKMETWLRMAQIAYEPHYLSGPPKSKSGKAPYIERDDGSLLADSALIIDALTSEHGVKLDAHLSPEQRMLQALATRTLEDSFYWAVLWERWTEHWSVTRDAYFASMPAVLRPATGLIRRQVLKSARGQGTGRMEREQIVRRAEEDLTAMAALLGPQDYFLGEPSTLDAIAYGFIGGALNAPIDGFCKQAASQQANLVAHVERMRERYWAGWQPPGS